jgi:hypothetical protein
VINNSLPVTDSGHTSSRRFALALAPLLVGAGALLAGSASGAVAMAFAGEIPVTTARSTPSAATSTTTTNEGHTVMTRELGEWIVTKPKDA